MQIQKNVAITTLTTLRVGGIARYVIEIDSEASLEEALQFCTTQQLPYIVLGGGSNVVCASWNGVLLLMQTKGVTFREEGEAVMVKVAAGENWDQFVARCVERGWWGVENVSAIPGSVGATPIQNVGAYGVEVKDCIKEVEVLNTETMQREVLSAKACQFGYRDSVFKHKEGRKYIIVSVTFVLSKRPRPQLHYKDLQAAFAETKNPSIQDIRTAVINIRSKKFPSLTEYGTAGSFFKNPIIPKEQYVALQQDYPSMSAFDVDEEHVKIPLAWILDRVCALKGTWFGAVGLFEQQPLVLVTKQGATYEDVVAVMQKVQQIVFEKTSIAIENEVTIIKNV